MFTCSLSCGILSPVQVERNTQTFLNFSSLQFPSFDLLPPSPSSVRHRFDRHGGGSLPPLYFAVGASESILGDSVRVAQHAAQGGCDVILEARERRGGGVERRGLGGNGGLDFMEVSG